MTRSMSGGSQADRGTGDGEGEGEVEGGLWGHRRRWSGVPARAVFLILLVAVVWGWLALWDYDHPAAPPARRLASAQVSERLAAVKELERFGVDDPEVALPALMQGLKDAVAEVRVASATAVVSVLPSLADEGPRKEHANDAIRILVGGVTDPNVAARAAATQCVWMVAVVSQIPDRELPLDRVVAALTGRLDDPEASVRLAALQGIGVVGPKVSEDPPPELISALYQSTEENRNVAGLALSGYTRGFPRLLPTLVRSLDSSRPGFRAAFLRALEPVRQPRFGVDAVPGLAAVLESRDIEAVELAVSNLVAFSTAAGPAAPDLAAALNRWVEDGPSGDPKVSRLVTSLVGALWHVAPVVTSQDEAVGALAKLLRSEFDREARIAAARALGRFRPDPVLFATLTEAIDDREPDVRVAAMWAIDQADFGVGYTVPQSLGVALEDASPQIRAAAAAALGHSGGGLDPFLPAILDHARHDPEKEVRAICKTVLGVCVGPAKVSPSVVPLLAASLEDAEPDLRDEVAALLSRLGPDAVSAIPALLRSLKPPGPGGRPASRWQVAAALGKIAPGSSHASVAVAGLDESLSDSNRRDAISILRALANFGPKAAIAVPRLRQFQEHKDPELRLAATEALAKIIKN